MRWPWQREQKRYNEYEASGAAVLLTTYGDPDVERIQPMFQHYADLAYAGNSIVFGAILARIALFSEAELTWQNLRERKTFGTPDLDKLEVPWPNGTAGDLMARAEQDVSLAGNFYVRDIPEANRLERLRPDRVTIVSELSTDAYGRPYREVIGFAYDRSGYAGGSSSSSDIEFYDVSEVAHWAPTPDPCAEFRGMSWLTPVIREVQADQGLTEFKTKYIEHGATPNLLIKYAQKLKPATITSIEDRLTARHGGAANAGKVMVLDQGADETVVGNSMEQANFTTVQAAGENRILIASGVPGIVVGSKEGLQAATYSNYAQAMRRFTDLWAWPEWRSFVSSMAKLVDANRPGGARLWVDTSHISALQASQLDQANVMLAQSGTVQRLVFAGFEPQSAIAAVNAGDLTLLTHTGHIPTSLYETVDLPQQVDGTATPLAIGAN